MDGDVGVRDGFWQALEQVKVAEEVGFSHVFSVEHHFLDRVVRVAGRRHDALPRDDIVDSLRRFGREVFPHFAGRRPPRAAG